MPYVERDKNGVITGLFENPQPDMAKEFLDNNHPEIQEFWAKNPLSHDELEYLKPKSSEELLRRALENQKIFHRLKEEDQVLREYIISLLGNWAYMESAFANLFYTLLTGSKEPLAHAIYFSIRGFQAQLKMMELVVLLSLPDGEIKGVVEKKWKTVIKKILERVPKIRNKIAHGYIVQIHHNNENKVRVAPPFFNFIDVNKDIAKGKFPGLGPQEILQGIKAVNLTSDFIGRLSLLFKISFEGKILTLEEIENELDRYLQEVSSIYIEEKETTALE